MPTAHYAACTAKSGSAQWLQGAVTLVQTPTRVPASGGPTQRALHHHHHPPTHHPTSHRSIAPDPVAAAPQADFGLSKTLPINKHAEYGYLDSKFRLTGETGAMPAGPARLLGL